ncbi:MAG: SUMF1/EgtB/PvdO family nonheme iron enzyme, partial [Spirochaetaceae bacterium]|nr:SUMF1/EgtB/PvdO family nonheme iron enzyme [Spirochaetaceae bacterium]
EITNGPERGGGVGSALVIKTEVYPANATNRDVKWSSEDSEIADVVGTANGATVHLRKVGSTKIRVKPANGGKESVCVITVIPAGAVVNVTGVQVYPPSLLLGMGESSMLMAQVLPGHATDHGIEWSSSDEGVVKVDTNGIVTTLAPGSATISAISASDSRKYGECVVTVNQFVFMKGGMVPIGYNWGGTTGDYSNTTSTAISVAPFYIIETEVRYELWYEVRKWGEGCGYEFKHEGQEGSDGTAGAAPDPITGKDLPVTRVSWTDVVVWCNAYSEMTGKEAVYYDETGTILLRKAETVPDMIMVEKAKQLDRNGYRLPTGREWEYAARGGIPSQDSGAAWTYQWAGNNTAADDVSWNSDNAQGKIHPVRKKAANSAGLYDMSGNLFEWCFATLGDERVIRGGSWLYGAPDCSVASCETDYPDNWSSDVGVRLVCSR